MESLINKKVSKPTQITILLATLLLFAACTPTAIQEATNREAPNPVRETTEPEEAINQEAEAEPLRQEQNLPPQRRDSLFYEYEDVIRSAASQISASQPRNYVPFVDEESIQEIDGVLYFVLHDSQPRLSGYEYLAVGYDLEASEVLRQEEIMAMSFVNRKPNTAQLDWWGRSDITQQTRQEENFKYLYDNYHDYKRQAIRELEDVVGLELSPYGGHEERFKGSVFTLLYKQDSWGETLRFWVVEQSAETGEVLRHNEISNDGCPGMNRCPNLIGVWDQ